jgi:hypothetical protein
LPPRGNPECSLSAPPKRPFQRPSQYPRAAEATRWWLPNTPAAEATAVPLHLFPGAEASERPCNCETRRCGPDRPESQSASTFPPGRSHLFVWRARVTHRSEDSGCLSRSACYECRSRSHRICQEVSINRHPSSNLPKRVRAWLTCPSIPCQPPQQAASADAPRAPPSKEVVVNHGNGQAAKRSRAAVVHCKQHTSSKSASLFWRATPPVAR